MKVVQLSGGVGGARLARGFAALDGVDFTVVVNVGDDSEIHGIAVSPDVDTVCYTLAGVEGPMGWGRAKETFDLNEELARYGIDNTFRLGDRDLALKLARTVALQNGETLSAFTKTACRALGVHASVLPATDDKLRTVVQLESGWTSFMDYFVARRHQDVVKSVRFDGAENADPAPGVIEAIAEADLVVIGPSNPILSIWPIMSIPRVREALDRKAEIIAVSPLIGGKAVKGPASEVLGAYGFESSVTGVVESYDGLVTRLFVDRGDVAEIPGVEVIGTDVMVSALDDSIRLAREIVAR